MATLSVIIKFILLAVGIQASKFFIVTNKAELGRHADLLFMYAVTSDPTALGTIKTYKSDGKFTVNVQSQNLVRARDDLQFGCYLTIRSGDKHRGNRYGVYRWTATIGGAETRINSFVKPITSQLATDGVYTIVVYPDTTDPAKLENPLTFGVKPFGSKTKIKWKKGKARLSNTGPTLTLTNVKGSAGVYEIYRRMERRARGWAVNIEIIVSECPRGRYSAQSNSPCSSSCPISCRNGGVCDTTGFCLCPPFFIGTSCQWPNVWTNRPNTRDFYYINPFALTWSDARADCIAMGGDLATITSQNENSFIVGLLDNWADVSSSLLIFIGLSYNPSETSFQWVSGEALSYTNWLSGPVNARPRVAIFSSGVNIGKWFNAADALSLPYICEAQNVDDPYFIDGDNKITCSDLPWGNHDCKGYHFCFGDLYGCSCASGWHGNACDKKCRKGFYGPGCALSCITDSGCSGKDCDRFSGRC
ncbi:uncharacterized protein [Apostichopus japonicus]|uniref:uncharacterized protein n=1 Tax=Stichopus japonicus TaxID=307972 RepID=UPI003AB4175C